MKPFCRAWKIKKTRIFSFLVQIDSKLCYERLKLVNPPLIFLVTARSSRLEYPLLAHFSQNPFWRHRSFHQHYLCWYEEQVNEQAAARAI